MGRLRSVVWATDQLNSWQAGALVALWLTNRERHRRFVEQELLPAWGLRAVATWFWIKVADSGALVSPLVTLLTHQDTDQACSASKELGTSKGSQTPAQS